MQLVTSLLLLVAGAAATSQGAMPRPALLRLRGGGAFQPVSSVKMPPDAYHGLAEKGADNAKKSPMHILHQSVMGGLYVGIGAMLSLSVAGACPGIAESNPGLQKFIFGALFPMNLLLILTTGGQLFTGNVAAVPAAFFEGLVTFPELAKSLAVSYIGNVIGCGLMAYACSYTGLLHYGADKLAIATVVKKMGGTVGQKIVKAIMCNWLVCMAVFLCGAANDMLGKYIGIWLPISAFVTIGLEHSVANMFLLPAGVLSGADYTIAKTFLKNLLPVTFGNAIAGVVLVAAGYSYAFGALGKKKE